jgi:hypothetical protein
MHPNERQRVQDRWKAIVGAMAAAGIPRDELSMVAIVLAGELFSDHYTRMTAREARPIGFTPPARKEER